MTPHICVSVAEATLEELLQDGSLPSRPEESPPLSTVEEIWMTASQVEPRLHLTPPCKTQPDFAKSDMVVAKANRQVKKISERSLTPPAPFSENFIAIFSANSLPKLPFLMQKKLQ